MSGYSLAPFILRRPWLANMVMPAANWYANAAGYKKLGLRYATHPQHIPTPDSRLPASPHLLAPQISLPLDGHVPATDRGQQEAGVSHQWPSMGAAASTRTQLTPARRRYDDLVEEERESTQIALKRLSPKESYDRIYRIRRSVQCSYQHKLLPKDQWTKPEEVRHPPSLHGGT